MAIAANEQAGAGADAAGSDRVGAVQAGIGANAQAPSVTQRYYRRFTAAERVLHACLMLTFVGCALTGLPLVFADRSWAATLARIFGGFEAAGLIHRLCAVVMITVFVSHVAMVFSNAFARGNVMRILWGPDSLVPQPQDILDIYRNFLWFLGRGPRPQFDRWTYWEKFDYWAVFWGMFIIGGSGLLLMFPVFFAQLLPGWIFNIAALVHGEEALLAVGFIFTFHFFNGHLRPEKFPMDTVIFTGRITEHELKNERGIEYARMVKDGRIDTALAPAPTRESEVFGWFVGGTALFLGIVAIVLIVYSVF
jgi:cytochrome b subunit of formate dehydrogenase